MRARPFACDPLRLRQLLDNGLRPDEEAETIRHLDTCRPCQESIEALAAESGLWGDARHLEELWKPERTATKPGRNGDMTKSHDRATAEVEALEFLEPADRPGVLGMLGTHEVIRVLGRGGMGVVFQAFDPALNRPVAIKVLAPELSTSGMARRRFAREAQATAAIVHDHIIAIHAVEANARLPYLVMQHIPGHSLQDRIDRYGPLDLAEVLRVGMQVASGLAAAHAQGVIHRDIKPANILLENGVERVKITDFGLARALDDASLTQSGVVTGTPQYMAPEQARGEPVDHRADLFSLGSVLYAMCTGRSPFRAETTMAVLRRVAEDNPRPIHEVNPEVPGWLESIVRRLHAKDPAGRFATAAEVAELLGQCLAHVQQPDTVPLPFDQARPRPAPRRRLLSATSAAALLLVLMAGLGASEATGVTNLADAVASVLRIQTGDGTLLVELIDPQVKVSIDGEDLTIHGAGLQEIRLRPGLHEMRSSRPGGPARTEKIEITRGGVLVVRVSREALTAKVLEPGTAADGQARTPGRPPAPSLEGGGPGAELPVPAGPTDRPSFERLSARLAETELKRQMVERMLDRLRAHAEAVREEDSDEEAAAAFDADPAIAAKRRELALAQDKLKAAQRVTRNGSDPSVVVLQRRVKELQDGLTALWYRRPPSVGGRPVPSRNGEAEALIRKSEAELIALKAEESVLRNRLEPLTSRHPAKAAERARDFGAQAPRGASTNVPEGALEAERARLLERLRETEQRLKEKAGAAADPTIQEQETRSAAPRDQAAIDPAIPPLEQETPSPREEVGPRFPGAASEERRKPDDGGFAGLARSTLQGPQGSRLWSLAFSPDGSTLATGSGERRDGITTPGDDRGKITLWDPRSGHLRLAFGVRRDARSLAFSPDGKTFASAGTSPAVTVRDARSGRTRGTFLAHEGINALAFSPDGRTIATAVADGKVMLWDVAAGRRKATLESGSDALLSLAFAPDGKTLLAAGQDGKARLWDASGGRLLRTLAGHRDAVESVAFAPGDDIAVTASRDWTVKLWSLSDGRELATLEGHEEPVLGAAFSPDGKTLATCSGSHPGPEGAPGLGEVKLWDLSTRLPIRSLGRNTESIVSVAFSPDGKLLAVGVWDGTVHLWHLGGLGRPAAPGGAVAPAGVPIALPPTGGGRPVPAEPAKAPALPDPLGASPFGFSIGVIY